MNHLISIRTNILYGKEKTENEGEQYNKFQELIFLVDKPYYKRTNDGEIVRERGVEELRFFVSETAFETMMEILTKLKNASEAELS